MSEERKAPAPVDPRIEAGRIARIESEFVGIRDALGDDILDQQVCCDGNSGLPTFCGCRGETVRDVLAYCEKRLAVAAVSPVEGGEEGRLEVEDEAARLGERQRLRSLIFDELLQSLCAEDSVGAAESPEYQRGLEKAIRIIEQSGLASPPVEGEQGGEGQVTVDAEALELVLSSVEKHIHGDEYGAFENSKFVLRAALSAASNNEGETEARDA